MIVVGMAIAANAADASSDTIQSINVGEVVVTGSNSAVSRDLLPYTVSVIDEHQLEATGQTQLLAAISGQVPSLFATQRGILGFGVSNGGSGHIKMRGVGGDRASAVLMMADGQPQFAGIYSHHVADFYDKEYVERVEVLRGPGSVLYGSNAMAGVINIITRQAKADGFHAMLSSQYGSYNTWQTTLTATARKEKFSALVTASYDRTDGNIDGMTFKQWSGYAKVGYRISDQWNLTADYTLTNFKDRDPVYPKLSNPESSDIYRQDITRGEGSASVSNRYESTSGDIRMYYSYGNHFIDDPRHFHSTDDRFGIIAYQNLRPWEMSHVTVGFDFDTYSGAIPTSGGKDHSEGSMTTLARKRIVEYSPYLTISQGLINDLLTINGGVRYTASDKFHSRWIPQAGFAVNPGYGITVKGSVAMGYRNPSFRELYLYRMANPDLQPEKMTNYEVSLSKSFGNFLSVSATAYYAKGTDMIQVLDNKNVNTGRFINKGIEFSATSRPTDNMRITGSYSYLRTSLTNLTGAPMNQYYLGVDWQALKKLNVCADLNGTGGLFVSEGIDRQNYAIVNLKLSYDVAKCLTIFTRLENITDARYVINRGYEMPGFTATGGFKLKI